jgi:hypothetical protein
MADQIPPGAETYTPTPTPERPEPEHRRRGGDGWIAGVVLLILGVIFLLRNLGIANFAFDNWWALFILIPAVGSFATAYRVYQNNGGHMSEGVRGPLIGGLIMAMVAAVFLLGLSWAVIWPVFLIVAGVGALLSALAR